MPRAARGLVRKHTGGTSMNTPLRVAALAAVCAVAVSCGGGGSSTPSSPTSVIPGTGTSTTNAMTITITRRDGARSFSPNPAEVGGQTVVFRNADTIVHRVILNDGTIDTGDILPNATSREVVMPGSGTNYHCSLHPDMIGGVSPAAGGEPPACMGIYCG